MRIHKFVAPPANQSPPGDVAIEKYFGSVGLNGDGIEELNRLIENCDKPMVAIKAGNQILKRGPSQSGPLPDKWIVFSRGDEGEARSLLSEVCPSVPIRDGLWE